MRVLTRYLCGAVAAAILLGVPSGGLAQTCSLEMKTANDPSANPIFLQTYRVYSSAQAGQELRLGGQGDSSFDELIQTEPGEYLAENPVRGVISFGSSQFGFVLDASEPQADVVEEAASLLSQLGGMLLGSSSSQQREVPQAVCCDRLYFDKNQNGDLTDDEVVSADSQSSISSDYFNSTFPAIEIAVDVDGVNCEFAFSLNFMSQGSHNFGMIQTVAYREGEIVIDGETHQVVLVDYNNNGRFDDQLTTNAQVYSSDGQLYTQAGDRLYIDPDLSNVARDPYAPALDADLYDVCDLICLNGSYYELTVSPSGDELSLELSDEPVGYVTNPNEGYRAIVYNDEGFIKLTPDESGRAPLPAGEWKLYSYIIDRTGMEEQEVRPSLVGLLAEAIGPTLTAMASGGTSVTATATRGYEAIKVVDGETAELPFGGPFHPEVSVNFIMGPEQVYLSMSLVGIGGEAVSDMLIEGRQPPKPRFKITTPDGEVVLEDQFSYG
jgi:hypothetical protein